MRVACENCGFGLETDHPGPWQHTCPDGLTDQHVASNAGNENLFTPITATLNDITTSADSLNAMWHTYNTYHQRHNI